MVLFLHLSSLFLYKLTRFANVYKELFLFLFIFLGLILQLASYVS